MEGNAKTASSPFMLKTPEKPEKFTSLENDMVPTGPAELFSTILMVPLPAKLPLLTDKLPDFAPKSSAPPFKVKVLPFKSNTKGLVLWTRILPQEFKVKDPALPIVRVEVAAILLFHINLPVFTTRSPTKVVSRPGLRS